MIKKFIPVLQAILFFLISCSNGSFLSVRQIISLNGHWQFAFDSSGIGVNAKWYKETLPETVNLPGTLDENGKGIINKDTLETMRLSRERTYSGKVWYRKEVIIPEGWEKKDIRLIMERTKPSIVWVDTIKAGSSNDILTPQVYNLSEWMTPGTHTITILINNGSLSVPRGITGSHAWTDHTQTNWNGIIGRFCLEASNPDRIESIKIYPETDSKKILVKLRVANNDENEKKLRIGFRAEVWNSALKHIVPSKTYPVSLEPGINEIVLTYNLGKKIRLWSEFNPALYRLYVTLKGKETVDNIVTSFGMRKFSTRGTQFAINDIVTFLRGKHDACVFPLTGYPPMDVESWQRVFRIAKSYNINFYRFHSWTPPEAAFEAADIEGIYLQPELPFWGSLSKTRNQELNEFLLKEGDHILDTYGNHASFVMFALGNELSGDLDVMKDFLTHFRTADERPLFSYGSNNYLGSKGQAEGEDYYAGCRIGRDVDTTYSTHIRASFSFADAYDGGYINGRYPSTALNYESAISKCTVPAISTEVGQYQIYPNYDEMKKYTGVLKPWNFQAFKSRLEEKNMGDQALDFFKASGALSVVCYRADVEMAIRTPGFGGFHLLDLQDFPGQGTALVGILDAFMDSKGLIKPEEFSHFCNSVVPLLITNKFCWTNREKLTGKIQVANYSANPFKKQTVSWILENSNSEVIAQQKEIADIKQGGLTEITSLNLDLSEVIKAEKLTLTIRLEGTAFENSYPLWIYPQDTDISLPGGITISERLDNNTITNLIEGANILLFPDHNVFMDLTVGGLFIPDYWNYRMFKGISESNKKPVSPGTLSILTNPEIPLFSDFPTDFHSDWQWWTIVKNSRPFILDNTPGEYRPLVQVVDNIERNHKLGLIFEFTVGNGKLLVCMADLRSITGKPEARQLYSSILKYMASERFNPSQKLNVEELKSLFNTKVSAKKITGVHNISYD